LFDEVVKQRSEFGRRVDEIEDLIDGDDEKSDLLTTEEEDFIAAEEQEG
jgi:hypothetical protein